MRRRLTISSLWVGQRSAIEASYCPFIRLSGRWLERAGFRLGQTVTVLVEDGKLTITPMEETAFQLGGVNGKEGDETEGLAEGRDVSGPV